MRIVLFTSSYLPVLGGLQEAVSQLARELRAQGHEVLVVTNRYPCSLPKTELLDGIHVLRMLFPGLYLADWRPRRLAKYLGGFCFGVINFVRLLFLFRQFRPDVVNVHFLGSQAPFGLLAARCFDVRCVVSLHGDDVEGLPSRSRIDRRIFETVLHCADHVTACSHYLLGKAQQMVPVIKGKSSDIWNGICSEEFATVAPYQHPRPYLFAAGRLVHKKGFDLLLRAYKIALARGVNADLVLAGDGPEKKSLLFLTVELGLPVMGRDDKRIVTDSGNGISGKVIFWGRADRCEMRNLLKGCKIFVIPSRKEPFGIVALEALAAGKKVVAFRTGGLPEIVQEEQGNRLVAPEDCEGLADAIMLSLLDKTETTIPDMKERSWEAVSMQYLETYRSI